MKKKILLRGILHADLIEAKGIPDCDTDLFSTSDPFAQIKIGASIICKTASIKNDTSPKWQESFEVPVCHLGNKIQIQVVDKDVLSSNELVGEISFNIEDIMDGQTREGWYQLSDNNGWIKIKLKFTHKKDLEVPKNYFSLRKDCKVTPYQDAHNPIGSTYRNIPSRNGETFNLPSAFDDLYEALNDAKRFIYITGWSVWTKTTLVRKQSDQIRKRKRESFGELLKRKAKEGVRVLIMVWDEKTSNDILSGFMDTFDEETYNYFEGSGVIVTGIQRTEDTHEYNDLFVQYSYSHHQKSVILDAPPVNNNNSPRLRAFLGGLDITKGRFDTPEHELFKTIQTLHDGDFYNNVSSTTSEYGPRQPWHDIHCRIEGSIVLDVIANFTERWKIEVPEQESALYHIKEYDFDLDNSSTFKENESLWNTQLFRSITSDSALFDVDKIHTIQKKDGRFIDDSIHRAYIHHIRQAKDYIYIENQYFLGSAYDWCCEQSTDAHNLIPQEITQQIIEKINDDKRISVYVVIPMFPEGDPSSSVVQEILHWQYRTMQMMYCEIGQAIKSKNLNTHPTDYLSFFCLGKRESPNDIPRDLSVPNKGTIASLLRKTMRHMIYVHSKMMIVDDEYMIIGSANINQRSMDGNRDSEIAVGCFQPNHTHKINNKPRGNVHEFRMSLWAEHLSNLEDVFIDPGSLECMQAVNKKANDNWNAYIAEKPTRIDGHLLRYPIDVKQDGTVMSLLGSEYFPDTEAPVLGTKSSVLCEKLTT